MTGEQEMGGGDAAPEAAIGDIRLINGQLLTFNGAAWISVERVVLNETDVEVFRSAARPRPVIGHDDAPETRGDAAGR